MTAAVQMAREPEREPSLFALAEDCFATFTGELRRHGLDIDPRLTLVRGSGMLTFYDLTGGAIHLSLPDLSTPMGQLQAMVLGSYLGCSEPREVEAIFRTFVPRLVGHELGHYLRHHYGRFGADMWQEEQVANRFATALTQRRTPHAERAATIVRLQRALDALAEHVAAPGAAALTYEDVLAGLSASGMVADEDHRNLEVTRSILSIGRRQALVDLAIARTPEDAARHLAERERVIEEINTEYANDLARYMHYHVGWMYLDLLHERREYIDDLAQGCLGIARETLPPLVGEGASAATDGLVRACFRAAQSLKVESPVAARYFHKRYRELLWSRIEAAAEDRLAGIRRESAFFLESFDAGGADALASLARVAPEAVRPLFPAPLEQHGDLEDPALSLVEAADARLYRHVARGEDDEAARRTLERLELLEGTPVFGAVPASSLIELVPLLSRLRVAVGEALMWEGDTAADVFFVSSGEFEIARSGDCIRMGRGEVLGEMAYFTRAPRGATVRARVDSECFVIRDADLTRFAFRHPSMVMNMARAVARRFARPASMRPGPSEPEQTEIES
jgi:hypothetical protein